MSFMPIEISLYKNVLRPALFKQDSEMIHNNFVRVGRFIGKPGVRSLAGFFLNYENKALNTEVCGIKFRNPIGLAAGFDKNGLMVDLLPRVGFGFEEIGSVTGYPWPGNKKPRLFRLIKDNSIVVNYGLSSQGSNIVYKRLVNKKFGFPLGINVAGICRDKTISGGIKDYIKSFSKLHKIGDYTTINISCPNLSEGMTFCDPSNLKRLLNEVKKQDIAKPIFLKISPDLESSELDKTLETIKSYKFVSGLIISNLVKNRDRVKLITKTHSKYQGGLSGEPVKNLSNSLIREVYKKTKARYPIIGCGGVFNAEDAFEKIKNGASLVQLVTGMIFNGPFSIKYINKGLVELMKTEGYKNIKDVVGQNI